MRCFPLVAAAFLLMSWTGSAVSGEVQNVAILSAMETPAGAARQWARLLKRVPELHDFAPVYETGLVGMQRNMVSLRVVGPMDRLRGLCVAATKKGFECLLYSGGMPKKSPLPVKKK